MIEDYLNDSGIGLPNASSLVFMDVNSTSYDIIENKVVQALFFMLYTIVFILGIFGNVLVCYVVFRNKAMQTVTNLFITNLALSDILLCVLAVPFTPLYTFLGKWVFGNVMCHLVPYAQGISVYISTLTLTSIAIDRFFVIIYPFHPRMKLSTCIVIIMSIWIFSILVTLPYGIYMRFNVEKDDMPLCEERWPSEDFRMIFGGMTSTMQFVIPFFIMAYCYTCVSLRLKDRARSKPGTKNSRKEEADRERKRRTNRMLIAMVVIFLVSWLPLNTINIINDFYIPTGTWIYYYLCFFMVHALAMSSTCYNPFLYAWLNENFRKEFKQVLPCFDPSGGRAQNASRMGNWRSERTCNGNETVQESLLPSGVHRAASIRGEGHPPAAAGNITQRHNHPMKADSVEVENVIITGASVNVVGVAYDTQGETVRLRLIAEETAVAASAACQVEPTTNDTQQDHSV